MSRHNKNRKDKKLDPDDVVSALSIAGSFLDNLAETVRISQFSDSAEWKPPKYRDMTFMPTDEAAFKGARGLIWDLATNFDWRKRKHLRRALEVLQAYHDDLEDGRNDDRKLAGLAQLAYEYDIHFVNDVILRLEHAVGCRRKDRRVKKKRRPQRARRVDDDDIIAII